MADRNDASGTRAVLERILPDETVRAACLAEFGRSVSFAHEENPDRWGVTLLDYGLRLNVGRIEVLTIVAGEFHLLLDGPSISREARKSGWIQFVERPGGFYRSGPDSVVGGFAPAALLLALPLVRDSHLVLIRSASALPLNPASLRAYSPGAIAYLIEETGIARAHPSYYYLRDGTEPTPPPGREVSDPALTEGEVHQVILTVRERNPDARRLCIEHYGATCRVCGMDFLATYGEEARGCVQVHHIDPPADSEGEREVDPVNDLNPVCPNCHAVIHRRRPPFTIDEVRDMLERQRQG
jgi:5-methylcytosine-specific restriction enzyme A